MAFRFGAGAASGGGGSTSPLTTKGDAWVYSNADTRLAVGTDGKFLMADSAATEGVSYQTITEARISTSDITTLNVTSTKHGLAPKSGADATTFLNGAATPAYAAVKDSDLAFTDITTNNSSTSKHGFLKKLNNDATYYMDGTGAWSIPAGSGGGGWALTGNTIGADGILGTLDDFNLKFYTNNTEVARFRNSTNLDGALLIGTTSDALYPDADIVYIKKSLGDQMLVTMQNTHNNVAAPSGTGYIMANADASITGGINLFNADWPAGGSDGVFPGETALLAFGGACVVGTQTVKKVRFIANNAEWANFDPATGDYTVNGGNLKVPNGILSAVNAGAIFTLGNAGDPASAGGFKAGVSSSYSFAFERTGGESKVTFTGNSSDDTVMRIIGTGATGGTHLNYLQIQNVDNKNIWMTLPESGVASAYYARGGFFTFAVDAGYGIRCNVNATNNSGWSIDASGYMTIQAARIGFFSASPVIQQACGANFTNGMTAGGTGDTTTDYSSLTVYATDAAAIRNNIYQLSRTMVQVTTGLRNLGLLS